MLQKTCKQNAANGNAQVFLQWNALESAGWRERINKIRCLNLLQSEEYLYAVSRLNQQRISRSLIMVDGEEAGICSVLEAGLFKNALHGIILDRGPLWFESFGKPAHFEGFVRELAQKYPRRFGRRVRFIPEYEDIQATRQIMRTGGFRQGGSEGYETIWLDLRLSKEILRKNLNPKWRNKLNQSRRNPLKLIWSDAGTNTTHFKWLMAQYIRDKVMRKYDGPSYKTMKALGDSFSRGKNMLIGCALLDKQPIAGILLLIHGSTATYQIGYTSESGRENRAHYALLWAALSKLKEQNIDNFDLGGVNAKGAKGVRTFKKGMGGTIEKTLGLYH
ncbi:MAG: peptidoglycan bridge formation glycyltransferase FemA/FemB family protein [Alphaproteobacteria bacterium]|nr:peptidoglycan bridge formation glycyltransferase FemA/FemB family protein [Alphaproteobacteria bacterium]